jgi:hypothetical protein
MTVSWRKRYIQRFSGGRPDDWTLPVHVRRDEVNREGRMLRIVPFLAFPRNDASIRALACVRPCVCMTRGSSSTRPDYPSIIYHSPDCAPLPAHAVMPALRAPVDAQKLSARSTNVAPNVALLPATDAAAGRYKMLHVRWNDCRAYTVLVHDFGRPGIYLETPWWRVPADWKLGIYHA